MKKIYSIIGIIAMVFVSGCVTTPVPCNPPTDYVEYGNTQMEIHNNSQALQTIKEYLNSTNIVFYKSIKNSTLEDIEYKEITTSYLLFENNQLIGTNNTAVNAWVINDNFAIDEQGIIHEHDRCG